MLVVIESNVFIIREAAAQSITYHISLLKMFFVVEINTVLTPMSFVHSPFLLEMSVILNIK